MRESLGACCCGGHWTSGERLSPRLQRAHDSTCSCAATHHPKLVSSRTIVSPLSADLCPIREERGTGSWLIQRCRRARQPAWRLGHLRERLLRATQLHTTFVSIARHMNLCVAHLTRAANAAHWAVYHQRKSCHIPECQSEDPNSCPRSQKSTVVKMSAARLSMRFLTELVT